MKPIEEWEFEDIEAMLPAEMLVMCLGDYMLDNGYQESGEDELYFDMEIMLATMSRWSQEDWKEYLARGGISQ